MVTMLIPIHVLVLEHGQTQDILLYQRIKIGDEFTIRWIHSVELTPWEEIFKIDKNYNLILDRTRFKQFGAGVPDQAGTKTEIIDGYIIFSGINQYMERLPLGISSFAEHSFTMADINIPLYELVPDGQRIDFYTDSIPLYRYIVKTFEN